MISRYTYVTDYGTRHGWAVALPFGRRVVVEFKRGRDGALTFYGRVLGPPVEV